MTQLDPAVPEKVIVALNNAAAALAAQGAAQTAMQEQAGLMAFRQDAALVHAISILSTVTTAQAYVRLQEAMIDWVLPSGRLKA
jgi:hypothetical protein